jgi:hypothetical protein
LLSKQSFHKPNQFVADILLGNPNPETLPKPAQRRLVLDDVGYVQIFAKVSQLSL